MPDMTTAGTKTVTVTYADKTATFEIAVSEPQVIRAMSMATEKSIPPTLDSFFSLHSENKLINHISGALRR